MTSQSWQATFGSVPVGTDFAHNGNHYVKMTTRTAHLIEYDRRFYFGRREFVTVDRATAVDILQREARA